MKTKILQIVAGSMLMSTTAFSQNAGILDSTFGISGYVFADPLPGTGEVFYDMITLPDDKIIMAGYSNQANKDIILVRLNANGSIDSTFGVNGSSRIDATIGADEEVWAVQNLPDGKLLIAGVLETMTGADAFVMRLNSDGSIDNSFGTSGGGKTTFNAGDNSFAIGVDIALTGSGDFLVEAWLQGVTSQDMAVFKFTQGGGLDVSFGTNGVSLVDFSDNDERPYAMSLLADERIVLVGYTKSNTSINGAIALLNTNGSPDNGFSTDGKFDFDEGSQTNTITSVTVTPDDKILVAGSEGSGTDINGFIMKFYANGNYDLSFSGDGKQFSDIGASDGIYLYTISLQESGRILTTGYIDGLTMTSTYALMLEADGSAVFDFGTSADAEYGFSISINSIFGKCSAMQSDGSILIGGFITSQDFTGENMYILRLSNFNYTGVENMTENNAWFHVYPNPATDYIQASIPENSEISAIRLFDMNGRLIHTYSNPSGFLLLPPGIENGIYFIQASVSGQTISRRIIIQH